MKITALDLPTTKPVKPGDPLFTQHASEQAIQAELRDARRRLKSAEIAVSYLETLLEERRRQMAAGLWP